MRNAIVKYTNMLSIFIFLFLITGCVSHHVPDPVVIDLPESQKLDNKLNLNIVNNQPSSEEISFGDFGAGSLAGDLKTWSGAAVEDVRGSLEKEGVIISSDSPKILKLAVTDVKVTTIGIPMVAALAGCEIVLEAETNEGYSNIYRETNKALNPPWACDAAMKSVVSSLLNDKTLFDYLSK